MAQTEETTLANETHHAYVYLSDVMYRTSQDQVLGCALQKTRHDASYTAIPSYTMCMILPAYIRTPLPPYIVVDMSYTS